MATSSGVSVTFATAPQRRPDWCHVPRWGRSRPRKIGRLNRRFPCRAFATSGCRLHFVAACELLSRSTAEHSCSESVYRARRGQSRVRRQREACLREPRVDRHARVAHGKGTRARAEFRSRFSRSGFVAAAVASEQDPVSFRLSARARTEARALRYVVRGGQGPRAARPQPSTRPHWVQLGGRGDQPAFTDFDELPGVRGVKRSGTCALVPIAPEKLL